MTLGYILIARIKYFLLTNLKVIAPLHSGPGVGKIKELLYILKCFFVIFFFIFFKCITNGNENKLKQKGKNN